MRFLRPKGLLAGFASTNEEDRDSPLLEAGEQWPAHDYPIPLHVNAGWELHYQTKGSSGT